MDHLLHLCDTAQQPQSTFDLDVGIDIELPLSCSFPTSSARNDPLPQHTPLPGLTLFSHTAPASHSYDRLRILIQEEQVAAQTPVALPACTTYSTHVPRLHQVATGVLSDGSLTINHPAVRHFLTSAETDACVVPPASPPIFALAALAVFYHPKKPAHWTFWNKGQRDKTAAIVHKVLNVKPQPIQSPVAWMGIPENLSVVVNLQYGWREHLSNFPWYAPFAEPKPSPSKSRMNLRKRKAPLTQQLPPPPTGDTPEDPAANADPCTLSPPRKRPRTRRTRQAIARTTTTTTTAAAPNSVIPGKPDEEQNQPRSTTSHPPSRDASTTTRDDGPAPRTSQRQKARKALAALSPSPSTPIKPDSPSPVTPRTRSSSCTGSRSECSTAVSSYRVRRSGSSASASPSDLSAATAVEVVDGELVKGEDEEGKRLEEDAKRKGPTRNRKSGGSPRTSRPPGSRVSARLSAAKVEKSKVQAVPSVAAATAVTPALTKSRASVPAPYTTNKEEQIALGRRKSASASAPAAAAAATTVAKTRSRKRKRAR